MSTVEALFKFLSSYPAWAKIAMLAGVAATFAVALLAPRAPIDVEAQSKPGATGSAATPSVALKIHGVNGAGLPPGAAVRVTAILNGKAYLYPSLAAVDWLDVGPTMSSQTFSIAQASRYDLRFEMEVKGSNSGAAKRYVSQETVQVLSVPHTSEYRLYPTKVSGAGVSRAATPGASIRYSIENIQ